MSRQRAFMQVDVFTDRPLLGNPLAVVMDGEGLSDARMAAFARWTHLSETTFLLPPTDPAADYQVRIFTPGGELPFAGHPTLGTAHCWLAQGGQPRQAGVIVQQCGVGLVRVKRDGTRLAFAAPPLRRGGPVAPELHAQVLRTLRLPADEVLDVVWVDNGPHWIAARLKSAEAVLALRPDYASIGQLELGAIGPYPAGAPQQFEVRAFVPDMGVFEDPVCGSLNAGMALWMMEMGHAGASYVVSQGQVLGRDGRIHVRREGADTWVGGDVTPLITGAVTL
ncbi:PhzF family phenazine biosynthesis protein [Roseateles toxinivorans]|uniref:PhzF family phenazine biosynthesis protein n=1 Tax=Roseateles toxinivorans TaxID=270368 RepID=A0A4R6QHJ8_9BURK|nr:PhzF family phenazine biosynthesis protein [Roseateles toxinivorans]TDP62553.1 PhzF family phenazine biosynthesis protein [Roseateles toxinivorans]